MAFFNLGFGAVNPIDAPLYIVSKVQNPSGVGTLVTFSDGERTTTQNILNPEAITDPNTWPYFNRVLFWGGNIDSYLSKYNNYAAQVADSWLNKIDPDTLNLIFQSASTIIPNLNDPLSNRVVNWRDIAESDRKSFLVSKINLYFQNMLTDPLKTSADALWVLLYGPIVEANRKILGTPTLATQMNVELSALQAQSSVDIGILNDYQKFAANHPEASSTDANFLREYFVIKDRKSLSLVDASTAAKIIANYSRLDSLDDLKMASSLYIRGSEALLDNNIHDDSALLAALEPIMTKYSSINFAAASNSAFNEAMNSGDMAAAQAALTAIVKNAQVAKADPIIPPSTIAKIASVSETHLNAMPLTDAQLKSAAASGPVPALASTNAQSPKPNALALPLAFLTGFLLLRSSR